MKNLFAGLMLAWFIAGAMFITAHVVRDLRKKKAHLTYTVTVGDLWTHTNCVFVGPCPNGDGSCTLVRYVENGATNDFHAWAVRVNVETNR